MEMELLRILVLEVEVDFTLPVAMIYFTFLPVVQALDKVGQEELLQVPMLLLINLVVLEVDQLRIMLGLVILPPETEEAIVEVVPMVLDLNLLEMPVGLSMEERTK
jgi:hypothetical protein